MAVIAGITHQHVRQPAHQPQRVRQPAHQHQLDRQPHIQQGQHHHQPCLPHLHPDQWDHHPVHMAVAVAEGDNLIYTVDYPTNNKRGYPVG